MRSEPWGIGYLIGWPPLVAMAVTALNDHVLKAAFPSWWTGKLSDFSGVFFAPLVVLAIFCLVRRAIVDRSRSIESDVALQDFVVAMGLVDLVIVSIKLSPMLASAYASALGAVGFPSRIVADPTDLVAMLAANVTCLWYMRPFFSPRVAAASSV